jgi:hypothetical protein
MNGSHKQISCDLREPDATVVFAPDEGFYRFDGGDPRGGSPPSSVHFVSVVRGGHVEWIALQRRPTRIKLSWAVVATSAPSRWKMRPKFMPRPLPELGLSVT